MSNYVVAKNADGDPVYYTGRAGDGFVSTRFAEAFAYETPEAAEYRADILNRGTAIHGYDFEVDREDPRTAEEKASDEDFIEELRFYGRFRKAEKSSSKG